MRYTPHTAYDKERLLQAIGVTRIEDLFGQIPQGIIHLDDRTAVSDIFAPISGSVIEVNDTLPDSPEIINEDPYGDGWLIKVQMTDKDELKELMSSDGYAEYIVQKKEESGEDEEEED